MPFRNYITVYSLDEYINSYPNPNDLGRNKGRPKRQPNEKIRSGLEYKFIKDGVYFQDRNMKVIVIALFSN